MPDREARLLQVNNGKSVQSVNQSAWMTHWTGTRFESNTNDDLTLSQPLDQDFKKHLTAIETASDNFRDVDLDISLKKPGSQSFPFFKRGLESEKNVFISNKKVVGVGPQVSHKNFPTTSTPLRECHFQAERAPQIPIEQVKYHMFFGDSSYSGPKPPNSNNFPKQEKTEIPLFLKQNKASVSSTSHSPAFIEEQYKRMQKHIGLGFLPHQTGPQEARLHHGPCTSFEDVPHFVHDVETVSSLAGGLHTFSRTTHSLLITKKTVGKLYQENQFFRESRVSTQLKADAINCISPHGQRGVKLQLLDSSESQENAEDGKAGGDVQKNESSADTDAMDMESFKKSRLSGAHLSSSNKKMMVESNKDTRRKRMIELPDINVEFSALPAASISTEKPEPCSSRTQSLDMNTLQFNVDQPTNSKSDECSDANIGSEPGNRWIKRLKLTSKLTEKPLNEFYVPEKGLVFQIGECSTKNPQVDSSSEETKCENNKEIISLSHSWIQRWSHNQNHKNLTEENNKVEENNKEEFEKKQFPSIAAMALMGKAMTGFQQCKFQKKESCVVWNTKGFEH